MVSIITAAKPGTVLYLEAAYRSLQAQTMSDWQWCVQFDGQLPELPLLNELRQDERVSMDANGRWLGIAITRNRALTRADGAYVCTLDADDLLPQDSLELRAQALDRSLDIGYVFAASRFGIESAAPLCHPLDLWPAGPISPGEIEARWRRERRHGVRPQTVMSRIELVLALGGWAAMSTSEDSNLMLALTTVARGFYLPQVVYQYRPHREQTSRTPDYHAERALHYLFTHRRLQALRNLLGQEEPAGWDQPPAPPAPYAD